MSAKHTTQAERESSPMRTDKDSGAESVTLAVLFPLVLLLILTLVQAGLWWYAHSVASQAAQAGTDAGRPVGTTTAAASSAARTFATRAGQGVLNNPEIRAAVTADTVQVEVSGTAIRLLPIPGLDLPVTASAHAVKERFTAPVLGTGG